MTKSSIIRLFALVATLVYPVRMNGEVSIFPFISTGPRLSPAAPSPSRGTYRTNLCKALYYGETQRGPVGSPGSFTQHGTDEAILDPTSMTPTDYHSWGPQVGDTEEFGGGAIIGFIARGKELRFKEVLFEYSGDSPYSIFRAPSGWKFSDLDKEPNFTPSYYTVVETNGATRFFTSGPFFTTDYLVFYAEGGLTIADQTGTPEEIHARTLKAFEVPFNLNVRITLTCYENSRSTSNLVVVSTNVHLVIGATNAPRLSVTASSTNIVLSWPASAYAYGVEEAKTANGVFAPLQVTCVTNEARTRVSATLPLQREPCFFRLKRQ